MSFELSAARPRAAYASLIALAGGTVATLRLSALAFGTGDHDGLIAIRVVAGAAGGAYILDPSAESHHVLGVFHESPVLVGGSSRFIWKPQSRWILSDYLEWPVENTHEYTATVSGGTTQQVTEWTGTSYWELPSNGTLLLGQTMTFSGRGVNRDPNGTGVADTQTELIQARIWEMVSAAEDDNTGLSGVYDPVSNTSASGRIEIGAFAHDNSETRRWACQIPVLV